MLLRLLVLKEHIAMRLAIPVLLHHPVCAHVELFSIHTIYRLLEVSDLVRILGQHLLELLGVVVATGAHILLLLWVLLEVLLGHVSLEVHLLQTLIVVVVDHVLLTVVRLMRVLVALAASGLVAAQNSLVVHFILSIIVDAVIEIFVVHLFDDFLGWVTHWDAH